VVLDINKSSFANLTCRWSHRSNVWIPDFVSLFCCLSKILSLQKSSHSWDMWYPLVSRVVNQTIVLLKTRKDNIYDQSQISNLLPQKIKEKLWKEQLQDILLILPSPLLCLHTIWDKSFLAAFALSLVPGFLIKPAPSHNGHLHSCPFIPHPHVSNNEDKS
jgi:hypothetical protein